MKIYTSRPFFCPSTKPAFSGDPHKRLRENNFIVSPNIEVSPQNNVQTPHPRISVETFLGKGPEQKPVKVKSLAAYFEKRITELINKGTLKPGDLLPTRQEIADALSKKGFSTSRETVRKAFQVLALKTGRVKIEKYEGISILAAPEATDLKIHPYQEAARRIRAFIEQNAGSKDYFNYNIKKISRDLGIPYAVALLSIREVLEKDPNPIQYKNTVFYLPTASHQSFSRIPEIPVSKLVERELPKDNYKGVTLETVKRYLQERIVSLWHAGEIQAKDLLPHSTSIAQALKASPSTVQRAFLRLESEGLIWTNPDGTAQIYYPPLAKQKILNSHAKLFPIITALRKAAKPEEKIDINAMAQQTGRQRVSVTLAVQELEALGEATSHKINCLEHPKTIWHYALKPSNPDAESTIPVSFKSEADMLNLIVGSAPPPFTSHLQLSDWLDERLTLLIQAQKIETGDIFPPVTALSKALQASTTMVTSALKYLIHRKPGLLHQASHSDIYQLVLPEAKQA